MSLSPGARLGPYEILSPIGAGGMGEVYRARDTRLDRTVAVKVLPSHMSSSPEVRQRFEREARTISQLSHPHVCALYDVGQESGTEYLVMEYIEGQTLTDRLAKGALPLDQLLRYGIQIADALDRAHRQGIVHRDLKPGNIMLTKSGVKLLDFGLAKVMAPVPRPGSATSLPTDLGDPELTREGMILGTYQYMAPEQLEGREADARSDIFAFGAVLFEMATGQKAFSGRSQASLIAAILEHEPPSIATLRPTMPPALDRVVQTCLAKDPEERWQNAHDLRRELSWIAEASPATGVTGAVRPLPRKRAWLPWALTAVAVLGAVAAGAIALRYSRRATTLERPMRYSIVLPEKSALRSAVLSPDGTKVVFVARDAPGRNLLWTRSLDSLAVQPLPNTENPSFPFWAPDSRQVGFFADGKLKRISISGGSPQTLCDAPINRGGTWSRQGVILFTTVPDGPLFRVPASGGVPAQVTRFDPARGETSHRWPFFLPDGRRFLYLVASFGSGEERDRMGIYLGSLDSKEETFLVATKSSMAFAPPGYLLFRREKSLVAQPFDGRRLTGDPVSVAEQVQYFPQTANTVFSVSENGLLLYQAESASALSKLVWLDRSGREIGSVGSPANQANPRISPDGKRIAVDIVDDQTGNMDIWVYNASGGVASRLTSDAAIDGDPVWSPDGSRIGFMSLRRGRPDVYERDSSGAGGDNLILQDDRAKYTTDWSPDGRFILYRVTDAKSNI
ncbi:MAG TPA: protein kinase, partial [Thermoanaerobaculia bacterium]